MYQDKPELKMTCQALLHDFDGLLAWDWDNRAQALLAEFPTARAGDVRAVMDRHLSQQWDHKSIHQAPAGLRTATGNLGDLRTNQLLFASGPASPALIFAAWWPWGNGEVISLRLAAPAAGHKSAATEQGLLARLKGLFG